MVINSFQRSRFTFALSAKVAHIVVQFHVKTPYDKLVKIYTKYFVQITKMAAMPIYGKNLLKIFSRNRRQVTLRLGM